MVESDYVERPTNNHAGSGADDELRRSNDEPTIANININTSTLEMRTLTE